MYRPYCPDCHKETEIGYTPGWMHYVCKSCGNKCDKDSAGNLVWFDADMKIKEVQ